METLISENKRGSYADYVESKSNPRVLRNKVFSFVLNHRVEKSTLKSPASGREIVFPASYLFKLIDDVYDDINGGKKIIRYLKGEESISLSEQKEKDYKENCEYLEFVRGVKHISGDEKQLLDFMMTTDYNGSKKDRDTSKPIRFYLVDSGEGLKDTVRKKKEAFKLQEWCFNGDWDDVQAYARVLGIPMDLESSEIRYNLSLMAERDPDKFLKGRDNPSNKRKHLVLKAIDKGFLTVDVTTRSVLWANGVTPLSVAPPNIDPVDKFVESTFTTQGEKVYEALLDMLEPNRREQELSEIHIPEIKRQEIKPFLNDTGISYDEGISIINEGLSLGVITRPDKSTYGFGDVKTVGQQKFLIRLKENQEFLDAVRKAISDAKKV